MNIQRNLNIGFVILTASLATAACGTTSQQLAMAPTVAVQPVVQPVPAADATAQSVAAVTAPAQDGLHQDRRWPNFANCINNTTTQGAFNDCLRVAFMQDGTGTEVALLGGNSAAPAQTALTSTHMVAGN